MQSKALRNEGRHSQINCIYVLTKRDATIATTMPPSAADDSEADACCMTTRFLNINIETLVIKNGDNYGLPLAPGSLMGLALKKARKAATKSALRMMQ